MARSTLSGVQIVEAAYLQPGCCYFTRTDKGPFVDTGIDIDYEGRVYVSLDCVRDMASMFGFVTRENAEALAASYAESLANGERLAAEKVAVERALEALRALPPRQRGEHRERPSSVTV